MDPHTSLAIDTFGKILRAERRLEKLQREERGYLSRIPEEDRVVYFETTEEMRRQADA